MRNNVRYHMFSFVMRRAKPEVTPEAKTLRLNLTRKRECPPEVSPEVEGGSDVRDADGDEAGRLAEDHVEVRQRLHRLVVHRLPLWRQQVTRSGHVVQRKWYGLTMLSHVTLV